MRKQEGGGIVNKGWWVLLGLLVVCGVTAYFDREFMHRSPTCHSRKAPSDLVAIHEGLEAYALDHDGTYPATLAVLVTPDDHGHRYLN